jgi:hypothetical protein
MAKTSDDTAVQTVTMEGYEGHLHELDDYTVEFGSFAADADPAPLFAGLPEDRCQCPHWGVVLRGKLVYRHADGSEDVIGAGEAYYARPGHLPLFFAGTELVEFSPTVQFRRTAETVLGNLAATEQA